MGHTGCLGNFVNMEGPTSCLTPFSTKVAFGAPGLTMHRRGEEGDKVSTFPFPHLRPPTDKSRRKRFQIT